MSHEQYMALAIEEARLALDAGEVPVGAVVVMDDVVLSAAHNRREADTDPTAHAELLALREAARRLGTWRLNRCTLYVTLEPCPMCAGAAAMSRLGRVVYGASDAQKGCCGSVYDLCCDPALHAATRWEGHVLRAECEALLAAFFADKRSSKADPSKE